MNFWDLEKRRLFPAADDGPAPQGPQWESGRTLRQWPGGDGGNRTKIVICSPDRLDQTEHIVDLLQSGCAVLLNLESGSRDVARRLLDFIAGVAYRNENQIRKVARSAYLILPYDAVVEADGYSNRYCS